MIRQEKERRKEIKPGHLRWFEAETKIFAEILQEGRELGMFDFEEAVLPAAETLLWSMDALMPRHLKPRDFEAPEAFHDKTRRLAAFAPARTASAGQKFATFRSRNSKRRENGGDCLLIRLHLNKHKRLTSYLMTASLFSLPMASLLAQTTETLPAPTAAPLATAPIPAIPVSAPATPGTRTFTLDQILALALNQNSSVQLAREKVLKAQQLIYEANAAGLPQVNVNIVDTYSSNATFGTASGGTNSTGTLPGGGQIPIITDTGGGNTGAVTSSGGGGTATGAGSSSLSSPGTNSTGSGGTSTGVTSAGTTNTIPTNTPLGTGGTSGLGGTTGTDTSGTTSVPGTFGTNRADTQPPAEELPRRTSAAANSARWIWPPIMQNYAAATKTPPVVQTAAKPHDTTTTGNRRRNWHAARQWLV